MSKFFAVIIGSCGELIKIHIVLDELGRLEAIFELLCRESRRVSTGRLGSVQASLELTFALNRVIVQQKFLIDVDLLERVPSSGCQVVIENGHLA